MDTTIDTTTITDLNNFHFTTKQHVNVENRN